MLARNNSIPTTFNPIFYYIQKSQSQHKIRSHKENPYFLLQLPENINSIELNGRTHILREYEHHLKIHEKYDPSNPKLGSIHYTLNFNNKQLHIYLDENFNYASFDMRESQTKQQISAIEAEILKYLDTIKITQPLFKNLCSGFVYEKQQIDTLKHKSLSELTEISRDGTTSPEYRKQLSDTKKVINECIMLGIDHSKNSAILNLLNSIKDIAPLKSRSKKITQKIFFAEEKEVKIEEAHIDDSHRQPHLDHCDNLEKLLEQIKKLDQDYENNILKACIEGNYDFIKKSYVLNRSYDAVFIGIITATCIYHGHLELFQYIFKGTNSQYLKQWFCLPRTTMQFNEDLPHFESQLEVGYERCSLADFKQLLNYYPPKYCSETRELTLLIRTIIDGNNDHLLALLEAGDDPNNCHFLTETYMSICSKTTEKVYPDYPRESPLHYAVRFQNHVAMERLLEFKADHSSTNNDFITPLGNILQIPHESLYKNTIQILLDAGCSIDTRQTSGKYTMLYNVCVNNRIEWVQTLLKFKANPHLAHFIKTEEGYYFDSPLFHAEDNQYDAIVDVILRSDLNQNQKKLNELQSSSLVRNALNADKLNSYIAHLLEKIDKLKMADNHSAATEKEFKSSTASIFSYGITVTPHVGTPTVETNKALALPVTHAETCEKIPIQSISYDDTPDKNAPPKIKLCV